MNKRKNKTKRIKAINEKEIVAAYSLLTFLCLINLIAGIASLTIFVLTNNDFYLNIFISSIIGLIATIMQFIFLLKNASENLNNSIKYTRSLAKSYKNELNKYKDLINNIFMLDFDQESCLNFDDFLINIKKYIKEDYKENFDEDFENLLILMDEIIYLRFFSGEIDVNKFDEILFDNITEVVLKLSKIFRLYISDISNRFNNKFNYLKNYFIIKEKED